MFWCASRINLQYDIPKNFGRILTYHFLCSGRHEYFYSLIENPLGYDPAKHKFKKSWCWRYCKRWSISRRRRTNTKKKDLFERLHLIRNYHWWIVYQFANPKNWPKYWNRDKLQPLPESSSESDYESDFSSQSESVSDSSSESDTDSSETPSDISDDNKLHSSSEESISDEESSSS